MNEIAGAMSFLHDSLLLKINYGTQNLSWYLNTPSSPCSIAKFFASKHLPSIKAKVELGPACLLLLKIIITQPH